MKHSSSGFTLIELLVVIVIIGILSTLLIVNFSSSRSRARDVRRKSDLNQIKTAVRLYYNDFQQYPANSGTLIRGCGTNGTSNCSWGGEFSAGTEIYMKSLPQDPVNSGGYVYSYAQTGAGQGFTLTTQLENASDQDSRQSQLRCGVAAGAVQSKVYMICED